MLPNRGPGRNGGNEIPVMDLKTQRSAAAEPQGEEPQGEGPDSGVRGWKGLVRMGQGPVGHVSRSQTPLQSGPVIEHMQHMRFPAGRSLAPSFEAWRLQLSAFSLAPSAQRPQLGAYCSTTWEDISESSLRA